MGWGGMGSGAGGESTAYPSRMQARVLECIPRLTFSEFADFIRGEHSRDSQRRPRSMAFSGTSVRIAVRARWSTPLDW